MRQQIIICGHSRAGTTLLHEMMRQKMPDWTFYDSERPFDAAEHDRVVTKRPLDVFRLEELRAYSRRHHVEVILCIRDVRSLLTSRHPSVPGDYFYHADAQYLVHGNGSATLSNPGLLATHYAIKAMHDSDLRTMVVRYEETLQRAYEPGGAPPDLAVALNGDREIDRSRIDGWRDHVPRLRDQFGRFPALYDVQRHYGYPCEF